MSLNTSSELIERWMKDDGNLFLFSCSKKNDDDGTNNDNYSCYMWVGRWSCDNCRSMVLHEEKQDESIDLIDVEA